MDIRDTSAVFPTHVGVNRVGIVIDTVANSLPHARGGEPEVPEQYQKQLASSPRTWG